MNTRSEQPVRAKDAQFNESQELEPWESNMELIDYDDGEEVDAAGTKWNTSNGIQFYMGGEPIDRLPNGQYMVDHSDSYGLIYTLSTPTLDDLIQLPESVSEEVIKDIETFWAQEQTFKAFDFVWKRGILLYGPQGSGKTTTLQIICDKFVERGGVVFHARHPSLLGPAIAQFRTIEGNKPVMVTFEDMERFDDGDIVNLMDGEDQPDNVIFLATTNVPERLGSRLTDRPSRFDVVKYIGMPNAAEREVYLDSVFTRAGKACLDMPTWVTSTKGFSMAYIKELVILVEVFGKSLSDAVDHLILMQQGPTPSSQYKTIDAEMSDDYRYRHANDDQPNSKIDQLVMAAIKNATDSRGQSKTDIDPPGCDGG